LASDAEVAADTWPMLVVQTTASFDVEPETGTIQFTMGRRLIRSSVTPKLFFQISWQRGPMVFRRLGLGSLKKRRIPHVHATDTAPVARMNGWQH
jgi:hypothetical protein